MNGEMSRTAAKSRGWCDVMDAAMMHSVLIPVGELKTS